MTPAATSMTFSDFRIVKGRKVAQFIFETPLEQADAALQMLGGLPNTEDSRWVAVARMEAGVGYKPESVREPRPWESLSNCQQAAIRIQDPQFREWAGWEDVKETDAWVKKYCGVISKRELDTSEAARNAWKTLDREYMIATGLLVP